MFVCKDRVVGAMNMTPTDISNAFRRFGYLNEVFTAATYLGYNGFSFVYEVDYLVEAPDGGDEISKAKVYIKFEKQEDGSFALVGQY